MQTQQDGANAVMHHTCIMRTVQRSSRTVRKMPRTPQRCVSRTCECMQGKTHWRKKSGKVSWFCTISIVEPMIGYHVGPVPAFERSVACRSVMTSHMAIVLKLGNTHPSGMDVDPQLLA
jgi:hypothetical protein